MIFEHVEQHLDPMLRSWLIANFLLTKVGPRRVITCSRGFPKLPQDLALFEV